MAGLVVVGPWANDKLDGLDHYLDFYTKVLKDQSWRTICFDAFARSGRAVVRSEPKRGVQGASRFLGEQEVAAEQHELINGSHPKGLEGADYILKMGERLGVRRSAA